MSAVGWVVGARGWEYDAWAEQYYPHDLPVDWRLAYYANEFLVTLVPANVWSMVSPDNAANWAEETSDQFQFLFELPTSTQALNALLKAWRVLKIRTAGFLMSGDDLLVKPMVEYMTQQTHGPDDIPPIYLMKKTATWQQKLIALDYVVNIRLFEPMLPVETATNISTARGVILLTLSHGLDAECLKRILNTLLDNTSYQQPLYLILAGNPPSINALLNIHDQLELFEW